MATSDPNPGDSFLCSRSAPRTVSPEKRSVVFTWIARTLSGGLAAARDGHVQRVSARPVLVHSDVHPGQQGVTPRQPVRVENGVGQPQQIGRGRRLRRRGRSVRGFAGPRQRLEPQLVRQPDVAPRLAYSVQRPRQSRRKAQRSGPRPVRRGPRQQQQKRPQPPPHRTGLSRRGASRIERKKLRKYPVFTGGGDGKKKAKNKRKILYKFDAFRNAGTAGTCLGKLEQARLDVDRPQ